MTDAQELLVIMAVYFIAGLIILFFIISYQRYKSKKKPEFKTEITEDTENSLVPIDKESVPIDKVCPYCCETIKADAKKCKHCNSDLDGHLKRNETASSIRSTIAIHVLFILFHIIAFFCSGGCLLILTIPLHLIYCFLDI